jgi:hypothetical protein
MNNANIIVGLKHTVVDIAELETDAEYNPDSTYVDRTNADKVIGSTLAATKKHHESLTEKVLC